MFVLYEAYSAALFFVRRAHLVNSHFFVALFQELTFFCLKIAPILFFVRVHENFGSTAGN